MSDYIKHHVKRLDELLIMRAIDLSAVAVSLEPRHEHARPAADAMGRSLDLPTRMDTFWFRMDEVERVMRRIAPLVTIDRADTGRPEVTWDGARLGGNGRFAPLVGKGCGPVPGDLEDALDRFINAVLAMLKDSRQPTADSRQPGQKEE